MANSNQNSEPKETLVGGETRLMMAAMCRHSLLTRTALATVASQTWVVRLVGLVECSWRSTDYALVMRPTSRVMRPRAGQVFRCERAAKGG